MEIKQRINKTVQKRRLELPLEQAEELCAGKLSPEGLDSLDAQVAHEVTYLSRAMDLQARGHHRLPAPSLRGHARERGAARHVRYARRGAHPRADRERRSDQPARSCPTIGASWR